MAEDFPDPPMLPYPDSTTWFESGPEPIIESPALATLIVRVGLAANAIAAQTRFGVLAAQGGPAAQRHKDIVLALVGSAALVNESIKLIKENRGDLVGLASQANLAPGVVAEIDKLCDWKHPASAVLTRARHDVGFHWKQPVIAKSVAEYGRNRKIVWLEFASDGQPVHRLAKEVLAHALLGPEAAEREADAHQEAISVSLKHVRQALSMINHFFVACVYGYMRRHRVTKHEQKPEEGL